MKNVKVAVIGLGYVGLPVALAFARAFPGTMGFDISEDKVQALMNGDDHTGEVTRAELVESALSFSCDVEALREFNFFVVAVPTPVDKNNRPDLTPLIKASEMLGGVIPRGATIVFESTVYPGVTEDICGPALERTSGFVKGVDFKLGYSPERINPGDKEHTLERIVKVVSGEDQETLRLVSDVYAAIVKAGVFEASSIKVAEAAKVIENTQRDLNIALMNELALIFDKIGISTRDVLSAARTKWNFLPFSPGLVGGHCIGVDPYYLTYKAEEFGYHPQVILAGRRINDGMGAFIAQRLVKLLLTRCGSTQNARVGILGLTFKENVPDIRNSRVPDIVAELNEFGIQPILHDPIAEPDEAMTEYKLRLSDWETMNGLDGVILAVAHSWYLSRPESELAGLIKDGGVFVDVKSALNSDALPSNCLYWSL